MDTQRTMPKDDDAFRRHVRRWLAVSWQRFCRQWPGAVDTTDLALRRAWEDRLCRSGFSGLGWPKEHGGQEMALARQAIFHQEHARSGAPLGVNLIGHGIVAPTLLRFGSQAQKRELLPGILTNRQVWCQGYSEPGAGSDLAGLRTRATRQGDNFVLNGHKIWTSFADLADWGFVLARTDPDATRHRGISVLLVPMRQPGVRVQPIRQLTGDAEFCEVFFDNVEVPVRYLLGELHQGWKLAMAAASFERGTYFIPRLVRFSQELQALRDWMQQDEMHATTPVQALAVAERRLRWARLAVDSHVLNLKSQRALDEAVGGEPPGPTGSATKVHWSEAHQRLMALAMDLLGERICQPSSWHDDQDVAQYRHAYLWTRAETVLAGTSEIQRNIIAEKMLGLPRGG